MKSPLYITRETHEQGGHLENMWKYMIIMRNTTSETHEPGSHMEMMWKRCENSILFRYISHVKHIKGMHMWK